MSIGIISRFWFCWKSWRFKIQVRWTHCAHLEVTHLFQEVGCTRNKHVTHSSTDAEIISFDAGLRMDGTPAFDLWDLIIEVLHSDWNRKQKLKHERGNPSSIKASEKKQSDTKNFLELSHVDFGPSNAKCSHEGTKLYIFLDNEAVIKIIIKSRSPNLRHVPRTHRVALDWLPGRIMDP